MHRPKSLTRGVFGLILLSSVAAVAIGLPHAAAERAFFLQDGPRPTFDGAVDWINSGPIRLDELRGKVVLLDFWTYCCINCHHVLPELAKLEEKYKNELVVIGVHTPKFFAERDTENIRKKVQEYQIKHPVINDADQVLWNRFGVSSWPTLVLIDPQGRVVAMGAGEPNPEALDRVVSRLIEAHRAKGDLNTTPIKFAPESEKPDQSGLAYPGKVLVDGANKHLFITDTAHNRIVRTDLKGGNPLVIGDGMPGLVDGDFSKARFNRPQGMCLVEHTLYVADTENHALRAVDLKAKKVTTVAGDGKQTHRLDAHGPGQRTSLTSPWDVVAGPDDKILYIAMAGQHQIWRYDAATGMVGVWAGTGREDVGDGVIRHAAFAQPSGLATDGTHLYVADSEGSSIRAISFKSGRVQTVAGTHDLPQGQSLFAFDDKDAVGEEARLQHCLGVAYSRGKLYIADTYNNKIKVCDLETRMVETLAGSRQAGKDDDPPHFYQPGGLSVDEKANKLYVADTNNNLIRVIDLKERTVATLDLTGLNPPSRPRRAPVFPRAVVGTVPDAKVRPGQKAITLDVSVPVAAGFTLSDQEPLVYLIETPEKSGILADDTPTGKKVKAPEKHFQVDVPLAKPTVAGETIPLKLSLATFVCNKNSNLCMVKNYVWNVPITVAKDGKDVVTVKQ